MLMMQKYTLARGVLRLYLVNYYLLWYSNCTNLTVYGWLTFVIKNEGTVFNSTTILFWFDCNNSPLF